MRTRPLTTGATSGGGGCRDRSAASASPGRDKISASCACGSASCSRTRRRHWRLAGRRSGSGRHARARACRASATAESAADRGMPSPARSGVIWRSGKSCGAMKLPRTGRSMSGVSVWASRRARGTARSGQGMAKRAKAAHALVPAPCWTRPHDGNTPTNPYTYTTHSRQPAKTSLMELKQLWLMGR